MEIKSLVHNDVLWQKVIDYAKNCFWRAGSFLAKQMENNTFLEWEKVFVALEGNNIAGYCTFAGKDCIPNVEYTPYISFIFVGEEYRGNRLSEKMILFVMDYAKNLNYKKIYIISDHVNFMKNMVLQKYMKKKLKEWE